MRYGNPSIHSGIKELVDKGVGTYNDLNKTINIPGLGEIDVGKTLGGLALNTAFNAPISLVMYAMNQIPKSQSQIDYEGFSDEKRAAVDKAYGPGGVMEGYNAVSGFGKGVDETIQGRIDDFQKNYTTEELAAMSPTGTYNKLLDAKEKTGGTGINPKDQIDIDTQINLDKELDEGDGFETTPGGNTIDEVTGDITDKDGNYTDNIVDEFSKPSAPPSDLDTRGGGRDAAQDDFSGGNVTDSKSGDTYGGEAYGYNEAAEKGNDSGGGGDGCFIKGIYRPNG